MNTIAIINDISKNDQTIKSYCAFATGPCDLILRVFITATEEQKNDNGRSEANFQNAFSLVARLKISFLLGLKLCQ